VAEPANRATGRCTIAWGENLTLLVRLDDPATMAYWPDHLSRRNEWVAAFGDRPFWFDGLTIAID
jgi:hypothetical protein